MKSKLGSSGSFDEDSEYASSRYIPKLKPLLMDLVSNQLSVDEYPSVIPMPAMASSSTSASSARRRGKGAEGSARKKKAGGTEKWSKTGVSETGQAAATNFVGGRNLVFTVGGMAYTEMKIAREIMEKESREIIFGSTEFVNPSTFIDGLASLG
jgi:hypothetical protein